MLNEGWDEYFAKSHSQFKPSSEDAFGDSPSDINLDSINFGNKVCIGGVCGGDVLAYGKNTKEKFSDKPGSTENTEHLKKDSELNNILIVGYNSLNVNQVEWIKQYDNPAIWESNDNAKQKGSP